MLSTLFSKILAQINNLLLYNLN